MASDVGRIGLLSPIEDVRQALRDNNMHWHHQAEAVLAEHPHWTDDQRQECRDAHNDLRRVHEDIIVQRAGLPGERYRERQDD